MFTKAYWTSLDYSKLPGQVRRPERVSRQNDQVDYSTLYVSPKRPTRQPSVFVNAAINLLPLDTPIRAHRSHLERIAS